MKPVNPEDFTGSKEAHTLSECRWHGCSVHNPDRDPAYIPSRQWEESRPLNCGECLLAHVEVVALKPDGSCECCANNHGGKNGR